MAKPKLAIEPVPIVAVTISKEQLSEMFIEMMTAVDAEMEAEESNIDLLKEATASGTYNAIANALGADNSQTSLVKRENLKQLLFDFDFEEKRVRAAVQRAEAAARRIHAKADLIKGSMAAYMQNRGLLEIPTQLGYFKLGKLGDMLHVVDESIIPIEFFDETPTIVKVLNRERLGQALAAGKEVPGAHLETNRKNLLVR